LVPVADRYGRPRWSVVALAVPLAAATEPVRETLGFGQVNLLLALLIYADFVALRNRANRAGPQAGTPVPARALRRWWATGATAGVGVGLATAIKLTPGLFIIYFLVTKQWRAAATSAATAVGVTLLTFVVGGPETITYFTSVVTDTSKVGAVDATANQALSGLLARLYDSPTTPTLMWLAFAMLILAVGLSRAKTAHAEGDELTSFTLVGLTANAVCPISWTHHLVFVIPALVILVDTAMRRRAAARALASRGLWTRGPVGIPALAGLRHALAALGVYLVFIVSIWRFEHVLPKVSHYANGLPGALGAGMRLVFEHRHRPPVVVVADDTLEHHDRAGAAVAHRPLVREHIQAVGGDADQLAHGVSRFAPRGRSPSSNGRGTSAAVSPA